MAELAVGDFVWTAGGLQPVLSFIHQGAGTEME